MVNAMNPVDNFMNETEKLLDPQLWHACAGGMVEMPEVNSSVFYFPQGHAEHFKKSVDFGMCGRIPPLILSRVSAVKYLADSETDEVYAKIGLVPLGGSGGHDVYDDGGFLGVVKYRSEEKPNSFSKTLTQSDANNGGGFSVPRYCAETIFPLLDYSDDPPVQTIFVKDVHGETWQFRHIYRGTPRRHLLTTGWSNFVNRKKLIAGDLVVFVRKENGDIHVGIRRARRRIGRGPEAFSRWQTGTGSYATSLNRAFSGNFSEGDEKFVQNDRTEISGVGTGGRSDVLIESVTEAALLAASGQPFEVLYYPLACTPEFVVRASTVRDAMRIKWCPGMRVKMPSETEDPSRISWFMGTVSSVEAEDPIKWPDSPWNLLQVAWDEPDLLQNTKRVSPWLVELVTDVSPVLQPHLSPPRKKLRLPQPLPLVGQLPAPALFCNPVIPSSLLSYVSDNIPTGIQGARHAQCGLSSKDLHFNKMNSELFPFGFREVEGTILPNTLTGNVMASSENEENVSCLVTMGNNSPNLKKNSEEKIPAFMLFGKPIFTEQQMPNSCSGETIGKSLSNSNQEKTKNLLDSPGSAVLQNGPLDNSSDGMFPFYKTHKSEPGFGTGHCKVFIASEDVEQTLESSLSSFNELYKKLVNVFGIETTEMFNSALYQDATGAVKHTRDEPFSEFMKRA
nr:auxin response factor 18 [Ipomoea batatas]